MTLGRFTIDLWNPLAARHWCAGLHTCNATLMVEVPGIAVAFYFGETIDD